MKHLTGGKKVFAVAGAILLVAAASGTALARLDPGLTAGRSEQSVRQIQQSASGQAQQSPLPTSTPKSQNEVEFRGTVDVIAATGWVIGGRTVQVTGATEIDGAIDVGSEVKVHARVQSDGSLLAREIELLGVSDDDGNSNGNGNENENENDDNGNVNSNDDNGNGDDDDDNGNGNVNSNDDNGNGNDDDDNGNGNVNSNDDNGNDDHGGDDDDDDNGNDDHGGDDDDNDNGNDDHGGNSNDDD